MFKGKNEKNILEVGTQCMVRIDQKGKSEWLDSTVIQWNSKKKLYTVRTFNNQLFEVDRSHIKWTKKPGSRCTDCGNKSNNLKTKGEGILVGEALCPCCASLRGEETDTIIHEIKIAKEVING